MIWLTRDVVHVLHERLLSAHGGATGLRDAGLLDSALARPANAAAYATPDLCDLAAAYAAGIARNHPFIDGNKRTAFMAAYVFLGRNGYALRASQHAATHMMIALAAGEVAERDFAAWLRQHIEVKL